jgi:DNA modification methylase
MAGFVASGPMTMNTIIHGHVLDVLRDMDDESIDCCITSPPYWSLRDYKVPPVIWYNEESMMEHLSTFSGNKRPQVLYPGEWDKWCEHEWGDGQVKRTRGTLHGVNAQVGNTLSGISGTEINNGNFCSHCNAWKGQLGLEPTFELYIDHLIEIFAEVKRVLKKTGTLWVNLGDSYAGSGGAGGDWSNGNRAKEPKWKQAKVNMPSKSLCNIPHRFSIAMTDRLGMILRNTIIWHKPNCMPSSAKDRFTVDFEYVFFFTKSQKYYFKQLFEPSIDEESINGRRKRNPYKGCGEKGFEIRDGFSKIPEGKQYLERNKRCVWQIPTSPSPEAHFATFPNDLVQPMVEAGCPEQICKKCGKAREAIIESEGEYTSVESQTIKGMKRQEGAGIYRPNSRESGGVGSTRYVKSNKLTDCGCNAGWTSGIVLDCFAGTGTTCYVAKEMGRNYIGIDINENYCDIAKEKNAQEMLL